MEDNYSVSLEEIAERDLAVALWGARLQKSYLSLEKIAEVIAHELGNDEARLLADHLKEY